MRVQIAVVSQPPVAVAQLSTLGATAHHNRKNKIMKTNEALKPKFSAFSGAIAVFVLFGLMFISSLRLEKKWDAIACGTVCLIGVAAFLFSLRHNPSQMKVRPTVIVVALVLGAAAAVANWLLIRGH